MSLEIQIFFSALNLRLEIFNNPVFLYLYNPKLYNILEHRGLEVI